MVQLQEDLQCSAAILSWNLDPPYAYSSETTMCSVHPLDRLECEAKYTTGQCREHGSAKVLGRSFHFLAIRCRIRSYLQHGQGIRNMQSIGISFRFAQLSWAPYHVLYPHRDQTARSVQRSTPDQTLVEESSAAARQDRTCSRHPAYSCGTSKHISGRSLVPSG